MSKKEETKETKKTTKKAMKDTAKKEVKKVSKKEKNTKVKAKKSKPKKEKQELFLTSVKKEMGKVRWPLKSEMIKYSAATLIFVIFFGLFFALGDAMIAGIKMLVR